VPYDVRCVIVTCTRKSPSVHIRKFNPLLVVTLLGFALSVTLFVLSVLRKDGMSLLSTIALSAISTLTGLANKWDLVLLSPPKDNHGHLPTADLVVRYPNGSFLFVKCDEKVARALFFAPEEIKYRYPNLLTYRSISLCGTSMLMLGVVLMANATQLLQLCWGIAFIILNAAYWIVAALPRRIFWDFSAFHVQHEERPQGDSNESFTEALWETILVTRSTRWVGLGERAAPNTDAWNHWLADAQNELERCECAATDLFHRKAECSARQWKPKAAFEQISSLHEGPGTGSGNGQIRDSYAA